MIPPLVLDIQPHHKVYTHIMYMQCSPQAVLAYRADIPYVRKGYRPIRLAYVQR